MKLNLKKPIAFFDLETTGVNTSTDRIVEIAIIKVLPNQNEETLSLRINPEMPIPKQASDIHGITDEQVKDCPTFKEVAKKIASLIEGTDLAGFNSNRFDIPLLAEEFLRAGVGIDLKKHHFVDVQTIFHKMEQRTLAAATRFYCNKELEGAHGAEADTRATYEVLQAQLDKYEELQNDVAWLAGFSAYGKHADFAGRIAYDKEHNEVFNFGKYKGQKVEEVFAKDLGYYGWLMGTDFPLYTKKVFTNIKLRNKSF